MYNYTCSMKKKLSAFVFLLLFVGACEDPQKGTGECLSFATVDSVGGCNRYYCRVETVSRGNLTVYGLVARGDKMCLHSTHGWLSCASIKFRKYCKGIMGGS